MAGSDLIVIGGGPVGLITAIRAAREGLRVRLFDRRRPPIDKACGEGVMPHGVSYLESLGIRTDSLGRPFFGVRWIDGRREAEARFNGRPGLGIRRPVLHAALVERARECGVDLRWRVRVEGLGEHGVETSVGRFHSEWVAAADGLHSRTRGWIGTETGRDPPADARYGVRRHFRVRPWTDFVEVHWGERSEAYVTPVGEREVGVAILWKGGGDDFGRLLSRFPRLAERLESAPATSKDRGAGPLKALPTRLVRGHVALIGDAAGYVDAITGEGLSLGFRQAEAFVRAIHAGSLEAYEGAARRIAARPFRLARSLLFFERRPLLRRGLVGTLARHPGLFDRLLYLVA